MKLDEMINLSEPSTKRKLMGEIGAAQGLHDITIKPVKGTRRQRANRYYFGCIVEPFRKFEEDQGNHITRLMAHEFLKKELLPVDIVDGNGVVIDTIGATSHDKSIGEFADYVTRCKEWLLDKCGIVCEEPAEEFNQQVKA